ncbi:MAG: hypothetical protein EVG15_04490 [Candidatus Acididesulfobacter diazotrophicus]|uniref:PIN domain-containing protein n=1 Tax=Candidatus Acididesulfobacter diazotrophicus TaxID=2597226 RepID=A0A519BN06_9DELT|nr:MAG: hypothetical protein EVG15_04490 [Candidatus Acididesulfobacter diazotrophicus]
MPETVALDTNFIISILIKRNNTERALNILSGAIEHYEKIFVANQVIKFNLSDLFIPSRPTEFY